MSEDTRELERFGEQFISSFEAIRRALGLYPPNHPTVAGQLKRFVDSVADLRSSTGEAKVSLAASEFYVNGVPLKRLSLSHAKVIADWEKKGVGLIAFDDSLDPASTLGFFRAFEAGEEEVKAAGGIDRLLEAAHVRGIQLARVSVGVQAEPGHGGEAELEEAMAFAQEASQDLDQARNRTHDSFNRLLMAFQEASFIDPRVRVTRNLSQLVETRLLERRAVRELVRELRRHDRESYRHAVGGAVTATLMGAALDLEPRHLRLLGEAALLRDIGKLLLPPDVLWNRDRDPETRKLYERHPLRGARLLLERWEIDPTAAIVAYEHHARLDLNGFPRLGARKSMHAFSRVVAVASDYDRMTGGYPGLPWHTVWEAAETIVRGIGSVYDPAAVRSFLHVAGAMPEGTPVKLCDGREGIVAGTGRQNWMRPEVAILRDAAGNETGPEVVETDGLAPPGEPVVTGIFQLSERDLERMK